jgi:hemoglobin
MELRIEMMPSHPTGTSKPWGHGETPYVEIGGADGVRELAEAFYDVIEDESPTLRAMLPASTRNTRRKFFMYLSGWLGGPPLYEEKWGHPRLRMRHMPFSIGPDEVSEWMRCMRRAMDRSGIEEPLRSFLDERFEPLALHMQNQS